MDEDILQYMRPSSLTDLPLNILFNILSNLEAHDLMTVSCTCSMLRTLSNENLIYRNKVKGSNGANWWTRRLVTDVFDILEQKRNFLLTMTTRHNVSVIESLRHIQNKFNLNEEPHRKKTRSYSHSRIDEVDGSGNIIITKNNNGISSDKRNFTDIISNRDALTYQSILQGIKAVVDSQDENMVDRSHTTKDRVHQTYTIGELSPSTSDKSRSSDDSIFSGKPILGENEWKAHDEPSSPFKGVLNTDTVSTGSSSLSSSSDSLDRLRNSKHVRDKAALFEKLLFKENNETSPKKNIRKTVHINQPINNDKKVKSYGGLSNSKSMFDFVPELQLKDGIETRKISDGYIQEVERLEGSASPKFLESKATSKDLELLKNSANVKERSQCLESTHQQRQKHKRSQLKMIITSDNKISYQKIDDGEEVGY